MLVCQVVAEVMLEVDQYTRCTYPSRQYCRASITFQVNSWALWTLHAQQWWTHKQQGLGKAAQFPLCLVNGNH